MTKAYISFPLGSYGPLLYIWKWSSAHVYVRGRKQSCKFHYCSIKLMRSVFFVSKGNLFDVYFKTVMLPKKKTMDPRHAKMYLLTCAPQKKLKSTCAYVQDSLIRVFVLRMKKLCTLGYQNVPREDSDQTVRMCRLTWIFPVHTKVLFLTFGSMYLPLGCNVCLWCYSQQGRMVVWKESAAYHLTIYQYRRVLSVRVWQMPHLQSLFWFLLLHGMMYSVKWMRRDIQTKHQ